MKILLIKPPMRGFLHEIGRFYPTGLLYLYSALVDKKYDVAVFDSLAYLEDNHIIRYDDMSPIERERLSSHPRWRHLIHWGASWDRIEAVLRKNQADLVGISCMFTPNAESAFRLADIAKAVSSRTIVVAGASDATTRSQYILKNPSVDYVVPGEGEDGLLALVQYLESITGRSTVSLHLPKGCLAFGVDTGTPKGSVSKTALEPEAEFADVESPMALSVPLPFERYNHIVSMITSRGCPYSCSFCCIHATMGHKYRPRSVASVISEIQHYAANPCVSDVYIEDDNFSYDLDRAKKLCYELGKLRLPIHLHLPNGIAAARLDRELVELMADAGFRSLFIGLETTSESRLHRIGKAFTSLQRVESLIRLCGEHSIDAKASLIVGLPGQLVEDIAVDVANLLSRNIPFWSNPYYLAPGSDDFALFQAKLNGSDERVTIWTDQYYFPPIHASLTREDWYWSWMLSQAVAEWPEFISGAIVAGVMPAARIDEVVDSFIAHIRNRGVSNPVTAGIAATPVSARIRDGQVCIVMDSGGCFCDSQHLIGSKRQSSPLGVCQPAGDLCAAAISLSVGRSIGLQEIECRLSRGSQNCEFALVDNGVTLTVLEVFRRTIERNLGHPDIQLCPSGGKLEA